MHIISPQQVAEALDCQAEGAQRLRDLLVEAGRTDADTVEAALLEPNSSTGKQIYEMIIELGLVKSQELDIAIEAKRDSDKRIGQLLELSPKQLAPALRKQRHMRREATVESTTATATIPAARATGSSGTPANKTTVSSHRRGDQTVKVNTTRMDNLVNMVGELVIAQQMVVQDPSIQSLKEQRIQRNLTHAGKIIRDLQEVAMSLRMVTVKGTFQKMARLVRDLATKSGKRIQFHMEGEDTELDRNVVEEIGDPLVHMIRNACDHGIETIQERRAAKKTDAGNLTLRAYHQGGSIVIEVQDDGRGLNRDRILQKAIERGIYTPDRDPAEIPDSEVYNLVFLPGFSTAEKVTDVSGRGVGMDVVRRNIEALRGHAEIKSTLGKGSTFVLRLPLTMAIIDGMVVFVGSQRYVIPHLTIEQSYRPTPQELHSVTERGEMASVRGSLLPIYRLNRVFGLHDGCDDITEALLIVLESNILGDGRIALIIDVSGLVSEATKLAA